MTDDFLSQDDTPPRIKPELLPDRWVVKEPYCEIYWHDDGCGMGGEYVSVGSCGASIQTALWHHDELMAVAADMRAMAGEPPIVVMTPKNLAAALDLLANDLGLLSYADQSLGEHLRHVAEKLRQVGEYRIQHPKPKVDE